MMQPQPPPALGAMLTINNLKVQLEQPTPPTPINTTTPSPQLTGTTGHTEATHQTKPMGLDALTDLEPCDHTSR